MSEKPEKKGPAADLSRAGGRAASLELLRQHLASAPPPFLEGALDNQTLTSSEMVLLLRNRQAPAKLLLAIGRDREWTRSQEVKRLLVLHPRVPLVTARNLLPHLYWRELTEVANSPRVNPVVRRMAEDSLRNKIEEMSLGERVALARKATPRLIDALSAGREDRLLRALLGNGKMRELAAAKIAADDELPAELLAFIANHHRWGRLRSVRMALLANPTTPIPDALQLLGRLALRDLQRLARDDNVPRIISMGADRKLQELEGRRTRGD